MRAKQELKRLIQQQIENPLAKRILEGQFAPGDEITTTTRDDAFTFQKTDLPPS